MSEEPECEEPECEEYEYCKCARYVFLTECLFLEIMCEECKKTFKMMDENLDLGELSDFCEKCKINMRMKELVDELFKLFIIKTNK